MKIGPEKIAAEITFIFTSLSAIQIYDFHIFIVVYSPLHGFIWYQLFRLINRRCLVLTDLFDDKNRD